MAEVIDMRVWLRHRVLAEYRAGMKANTNWERNVRAVRFMALRDKLRRVNERAAG